MKIALIGYGKMGRNIEQIALHCGHKIILKIDKDNQSDLDIYNLAGADVAIEFSTPHTAVNNIYKCFEASVPVVSGTTGWYQKFEEVEKKCKNSGNTLFYATNFSIGVNITFYINKMLASIMQKYPEYKISINETHHTQKLDYPSGTAITLAEDILANNTQIKKWIPLFEGQSTGDDSLEKADTFLVKSFRKDDIPGTHIVEYKSEIDKIEISHTAFSRQGFASGALKAAEWIVQDNKKGIFTMSDMLSFL